MWSEGGFLIVTFLCISSSSTYFIRVDPLWFRPLYYHNYIVECNSLPLPQVIAFLDALLSTDEMDVHRIMILTPVNTLHNWMNEIEMWIPERDFGVSQNDYESENKII